MFWAIFVLLAHSLGALTAMRAIMDTRTAQGAIAWAIILLFFPYVSVPAYWVFGRTKFRGYISKRRGELLKNNTVARRLQAQLIERKLLATPDREQELLIEHLAKAPLTTGNDVELLIDGEATFRSIFEGIEAARNYLLVEFYILRDDGLGRRFQQALIAKAKVGVRVAVLFDEIGSKHLPAAYQEELRGAGVEIHPFNTRQGPSNLWQLNFRNHRKIVVVDGEAAWVGGANVGDEYLGLGKRLHPWRDTHVKVTGPAARGAIRLLRGLALGDKGVSRAALGGGAGAVGRAPRCLMSHFCSLRSLGDMHFVFPPHREPRSAAPLDCESLFYPGRTIHQRTATGGLARSGCASPDSRHLRRPVGRVI